MITRNITVRCQSGLHNKQAIYFVQKANEFESDIWVEYENKRLNAKSMMGIMYMGLVTGSEPTILAEGPDADQAVDALEALVQHDIIDMM